MIPFLPLDTERVVPFAQLVDDTSAYGLWQGQSVSIDGPTTFAALAGKGHRIPTGIGVGLMPLHHPYLAAVQARGLAATTGQPVVAGFGPAAKSFQAAVLGSPYKSQLTAINEYVTIVRNLLNKGISNFEGEYFSCSTALTPMDLPKIEIGLGVLRPRMARLAGEIADAAITWITPASYLEQTVKPALESGALSPRIVAMVPGALETRHRSPRDLVLAGNSGHLRLPHYQAMLREAGGEVSPTDIAHNADELLRLGGFMYGDESALAEKIRRFEHVGVDELVVNCTAVTNVFGLAAGLREARRIVEIATEVTQETSTTQETHTKGLISL